MPDNQTSTKKQQKTARKGLSVFLDKIGTGSVSFLPENGRIAVGAVFVGIIAGIATSALKWAILCVGKWMSLFLNPESSNWNFMLYPIIGLFLALTFQLLVKQQLSHDTALLKQRIATGDYYFKKSLMWNPLIACWLTIGFGGSAGGEGPSAFSGGAIGSCVSRWLGIPAEGMAILVACGAGAGIAGIFKSPVGGALFTLEVLKMSLSTIAVLCLILACLCSFATSYMITNFTWDVSFQAAVPFNPHHLLWFALLGLFCGIYSIYYNHTRNLMARRLSGVKNIWIKCLVSGIGMSVMIFFLPAMFGEGYDVMTQLINDIDKSLFLFSPFIKEMDKTAWVIGLLVAILLLKSFAVAAANYGGGVAGEFAPTLFAGSVAGFLFATVMNLAFDLNLPPGTFALMGMAGVMTGTVGAPLMSIFIAAECSASYGFLLGFMLTAGISYIVVTGFCSLTEQRTAAPIHSH